MAAMALSALGVPARTAPTFTSPVRLVGGAPASPRRRRPDVSRGPVCLLAALVARARFSRGSAHSCRRAAKEESREVEFFELNWKKELSSTTVLQRLSKPKLPDAFTLLGDLATCGLVAPMLSTFSLLVGLSKPDWLRLLSDTDKNFAFPAYGHGLLFCLSWIFGGLAMGAFEANATNSRNLLETIQRNALAACATFYIASTVWLVLSGSGLLEDAYSVTGYVTGTHVTPSYRDFFFDQLLEVSCLVAWRFVRAVFLAESSKQEKGAVDARLLFGDMLVAGVITPAIIIVVSANTQMYTPLWTVLWDATDYGMGKAILAHGSVLTSCWLAGALLVGAYSKDAMEPSDLAATVKCVWSSGAVAAALLAACSLLSLIFLDSRGAYLTAFDADRTLQQQFFDFLTDVEFGAICLTTWRLYFAGYF